ncbi:MAG: hypothetical protein K2J78_01770, partial [Muribaculaceae bacterium]|nr:hypothetical protein [Muribaculaceae bacterium]
MLKKLLSTLVCLPFAFACFSAQLTATLQSGDQVTPFYGENAFVEAYEAAVDGDIITLSPGEFSSPIDITKSVTIIGTYAFSEKPSEATMVKGFNVYADNVRIEGIRFIYYSFGIFATDHLTFSSCYIPKLEDMATDSNIYHTNTMLVDCLIYECSAMEYSQNMVFRNCCINYFTDINDKTNVALIEKCNIPLWLFYT